MVDRPNIPVSWLFPELIRIRSERNGGSLTTFSSCKFKASVEISVLWDPGVFELAVVIFPPDDAALICSVCLTQCICLHY